MDQYNSLAKDIVAHVGGKENVLGLRHCVTRLRFNLADAGEADDEYLKNLEGVITIMKAMGEYMVVIGEHVPYVYEEVCKEIGMQNEVTSSNHEKSEKKVSIVQRILGIVMAAMGPTLNMLCACGIVKGILAVLSLTGLLEASDGAYMLINAIGDSIFYFLPLLLGFNLAKKLDMEPFLGFLIGAAMCYPGVNGVDIDLFGYVINATYSSSFLPVIFMVCLGAPLYQWLRKVIPEVVRNFLVPVIVLLIIVPLGFAVIGPLANLIGTWINMAINFLFELSPVITGTLLSGIWQILVLFGVHGVLLMFPFMELMQGNSSQIMAFASFACFAQIGVVLAIYFKTKNKKLKSIALPSFISGIFGVTEPAIYGVTLPRIKMFIVSCIGAAFGGLIIGLTNITMYTYTGLGVVGLLGLISPTSAQILPIVLLVAVPFLISFGIAYVVFKDEEDALKKEEPTTKSIPAKEIVLSPIKGEVQALSTSKDEAFSSGALGKGVVIVPEDGVVNAPFDGVVRTLFPTKHAIGIVSKEGCEVLIHIGIDTVRLDGEGFQVFVEQGDEVKAGQALVAFDRRHLLEKGYDITTPILVTNYDNYLDIAEISSGHVNVGEPLLAVLR